MSQNSEVNKMTPSNIGIVWGPNVLCTAEMLPILSMNGIVSNIVKYHKEIFGEDAPEPKDNSEPKMIIGEEKPETFYLSILRPTAAEVEQIKKLPSLRAKACKKEMQKQMKVEKMKKKIEEKKALEEEAEKKRLEKEKKKESIKKKQEIRAAKAMGIEERANPNELRIVMVGSTCVGKSCLVTRLRLDEFFDEDDPTLEDRHRVRRTVDGQEYELYILDVSGDLQFIASFPKWFEWGDGFMMVYNIGDAGSLHALSMFREHILKAKDTRSVPMCLVGTQADEEKHREVLTADGKRQAFDWQAPFTETSSLTGDNVEKAFDLLVREIRDFGKAKEETRMSRVERDKAWKEKQKAEEEAEKNKEKAEEEAKESEDKKRRMIADVEGFVVERGQSRMFNRIYHSTNTYEIENAEHNLCWYQDYFYNKDHKNFTGMDPVLGPIIVSVARESNGWRVIARSEESVERKLFSNKDLSNGYNKRALLNCVDPRIAVDSIKEIGSSKLHKELLKFEEQSHVRQYKIGVLFCRAGQTKENDMFSNNLNSRHLDKFLDCLGQKIELKGWKRFAGGLDVKSGTTGEYSVFADFNEHEIMFHVSTLLPFSKQNAQQLERKRHLGNDIVIIVFQAGEAVFDPTQFSSEFNHVWIVVREETNPEFMPNKTKKQGATYYRVEVIQKDGVPPFSPNLPDPPVFEANEDFRKMMLTKIINAENASYKAPAFISKMKHTRKVLFSHIIKEFKK